MPRRAKRIIDLQEKCVPANRDSIRHGYNDQFSNRCALEDQDLFSSVILTIGG
jgi:hypothetical protein